MILYHGTTLDAWKNIQKYDIDVFINNKRELDFGYGFYLGEKEYAKAVALEKATLGNEGKDFLVADFVIAPLADGNVNNIMSYYKEKQNLFRKWICYYNYLKPQYSKMKQYVFKKQGLCTIKNVVSVTNLMEGRMLYEQNNENL